MSRSLALLLAVFALLAPAYAGGVERVMERGDAACGCCCAPEAPAQLPSVDTPECGCSVPPSVPPAAPYQAPASSAQASLSALDLQHAPVAKVLPLPVVSDRDWIANERPARDTCCRERLGVWLL